MVQIPHAIYKRVVDIILAVLFYQFQLPWPYEFVIDLCLINTLNQCLKFFLKLIVARESLCDFYQRSKYFLIKKIVKI